MYNYSFEEVVNNPLTEEKVEMIDKNIPLEIYIKGDLTKVDNEEKEERIRERQRRNANKKQRGSVEFVHPDLKDELKKQGEDPNNPWVWLTSYSRIPVSCTLVCFL